MGSAPFYPGSELVFYEDLNRTHPDWYREIVGWTKHYRNKEMYSNKLAESADLLLKMSTIEAQKEINALNSFNFIKKSNISIDNYLDMQTGTQIVKAFNYLLESKAVFERHLNRIVGKNSDNRAGKITGAKVFESYFINALHYVIKKQMRINRTKGIKNLGDKNTLELLIKKAIFLAIVGGEGFTGSIANSGDWSKNDKNKGYQHLLSSIDPGSDFNNPFIQEVYDNFKLDELAKALQKQPIKKTSKKEVTSAIKGYKIGGMAPNLGNFSEILGTEIINLFQSKTNNSDRLKAYRVGQSLNKTDMVITIDYDYDNVQDIIEKKYGNRGEAAKAFKEVEERMKDVKEGFIIYTNAKDYTLSRKDGEDSSFTPKGSAFSSHGFSAGEAIKLKYFYQVVKGSGTKFLVSNIMSTMKGAVNEDIIEKIEDSLVTKMGAFLFDDMLTIGKKTGEKGRSIHLLYLDGIYVPLSFLMFLMARALKRTGDLLKKEPHKIFKVHIKAPEILYPEGGPSTTDPNNPIWTAEDWKRQALEAQDNILIEAHFLKNFYDIMAEVKENL